MNFNSIFEELNKLYSKTDSESILKEDTTLKDLYVVYAHDYEQDVFDHSTVYAVTRSKEDAYSAWFTAKNERGSDEGLFLSIFFDLNESDYNRLISFAGKSIIDSDVYFMDRLIKQGNFDCLDPYLVQKELPEGCKNARKTTVAENYDSEWDEDGEDAESLLGCNIALEQVVKALVAKGYTAHGEVENVEDDVADFGFVASYCFIRLTTPDGQEIALRLDTEGELILDAEKDCWNFELEDEYFEDDESIFIDTAVAKIEQAMNGTLNEAVDEEEIEIVADEEVEEVEEVPVEEPVEEPVAEEEPVEEVEARQLILECSKCGAIIIKDEADITVDEESELVTIDEACQYCEETEGYKIIGVVAPYEVTVEEVEDVAEEADEEEAVEDEAPIEDEEELEELFNVNAKVDLRDFGGTGNDVSVLNPFESLDAKKLAEEEELDEIFNANIKVDARGFGGTGNAVDVL